MDEVKKAQLPYEDDELTVVRGVFDRVRLFIGMYIGQGGTTGAMHLVNEIVTNSIDEAISEESPCDKVDILFDEAECKFIVSDNGRGIPFDRLVTITTEEHSTTKLIGKRKSKFSGGQNGIGIKVTVGLSDYFAITSYRGMESQTIEFFDGEMKLGKVEKLKKAQHGTVFAFVPSPKYLGEFKITCDMIEDYVRRLSYIIPDQCAVTYIEVPKKGKEKTFKYKRQGLNADVEFMSQTLEFPPVYIHPDNTVVNEENGEEMWMEMAFSYDSSLDDMITDSYCNYVSTKEGGFHEQAAQRAICDFLSRQAKLLDPNNKYEVTYDDCRRGLILAVNCNHENPQFEGQHKSKVSNKNIMTDGRQLMSQELQKYFDSNNGLLRRIIGYLRTVSKARMEANKIKKNSVKKASSFLDESDMTTFYNISDRNSRGYRELLITEGDSATSAIMSARNAEYQAVFGITGVVANAWNMKVSDALADRAYAQLIRILGCGIGKDFDINKLKWNAIIIATDKDVDGGAISSLICLFFARFYPEIIQAGRLFRVVPPLYSLKPASMKKVGYKGRDFVFDKKEYNAVNHRIVADNVDIALIHAKTKNEIINGKGEAEPLSRKEALKWLATTVQYLPELKNLEARSHCPAYILEYVIYFRFISIVNNKDEAKAFKEFVNLVTTKFPEWEYDDAMQSFNGSIDGKHITLIVDDLFMNKMAKRMLRIMSEQQAFYIACKNHKSETNNDPKADDWDALTLGTFLEKVCGQYSIDIDKRFKGLGEADAEMIFISTLNPKIRKLIRINMSDIDENMETMKLLHAGTEEMREARRKMLDEADITMEDIDN